MANTSQTTSQTTKAYPDPDPQNITRFTITGPTDRSTANGSFLKHSSYWRANDEARLRIRLSSGGSPTWEIVDTDESETFWTSTESTTYPWEVTTWTVGNDGSGSPPTFGSFVGGSIEDLSQTTSQTAAEYPTT